MQEAVQPPRLARPAVARPAAAVLYRAVRSILYLGRHGVHFAQDNRMKPLTGAWIENTATQAVFVVLNAPGHVCYFVGGCVRNALLEAPVSDIDLATNARPKTVIELCQ